MFRARGFAGLTVFPIVVVGVLLSLGAANIVARATFDEVEDGVLWRVGAEGVVAAEIAETPPPRRRIFVAAMCYWLLTTSRCRALATSSPRSTVRGREPRRATPCCDWALVKS